MFKAIKLGAEAILVLGALACILQFIVQFFDLKPKDIRMHLGWSAWAWLACGLVLFGVSLWSSGYSLYTATRKNRLAEAKAEKWKAECQRVTAEAQTKLDDLRNGYERMNGEREKYLRDECNQRLKEQGDKLSEQTTKLNTEISEQYRKKTAEWEKYTYLFSPLQLEAFQLAKELRAFVVSLAGRGASLDSQAKTSEVFTDSLRRMCAWQWARASSGRSKRGYGSRTPSWQQRRGIPSIRS